jgi:hypothetical protein
MITDPFATSSGGGTQTVKPGAGNGGGGTVQTITKPSDGSVNWSSPSTGGGLTDAQYKEGVQATIAAIKAAGEGGGALSSAGGIDPRANIDAIGAKLVARWKVEDEETKKRRDFGNSIATRYEQGTASYDSSAAVAGIGDHKGDVKAPGSWTAKAGTVSESGLPSTLSVPSPADNHAALSLSWSASSLPGGLGGMAAAAKALILLAASVAFVRGCMEDMRTYLVGLGSVNPAGNGVLVGVESVAPGVPQAKAVALAIASTAVIAVAWAGLAALLTSGVLGDSFGRVGGFNMPAGVGVIGEWVPFGGLVSLWIGRAMFDFVAAPVYMAAVSALKFMSV